MPPRISRESKNQIDDLVKDMVSPTDIDVTRRVLKAINQDGSVNGQPVAAPTGSSGGSTVTDHSQLTGIGVNTHGQIDSHIANQNNPHSTNKAHVGLGNVDNTSDVAKPVSTAQQTALNAKADTTALTAHTGSTSNPHSVTKAQVGLGSADNTSDAAKPVSTATQTALNAKADTTALTAHTGNVSNPHSVTKAQVGLANVDNTSDAAKPVSTAQQTALNAKQDVSTIAEVIRDTMGVALVAGTGITLTVNDVGDTITIAGPTAINGVVQIEIKNGTTVIPTGIAGDVIIPYDCTPIGWTIYTPESSTAQLDLWLDTLVNAPPTVADTVTPSNKIKTVASTYGTSANATGWTTTWNKDKILRVVVDSNNAAKTMLVNVYITRGL